MWIMVHGEESDAVTLAWEKVDGAECYEVQLKSGDKPDAEFATVSDKLSSTMVSVRAMPPTTRGVWRGVPGPQKELAAEFGTPGASSCQERGQLG